MVAGDPLHADALDAAERMLGLMARAGLVMLGSKQGSAALPKPRATRTGAAPVALERTARTAFPKPLPQWQGDIWTRDAAPPVAPAPRAVARATVSAPPPPGGEGREKRQVGRPPRRPRPASVPSLPQPRPPEHVLPAAVPAPLPPAARVGPTVRPLERGPGPIAPVVVPPPATTLAPRRHPDLPRLPGTDAVPALPARQPPAPPQLDEARLGRWLAEHLADETRRPARGGTGFDPRLSPGWPGTLQGPWGWGG